MNDLRKISYHWKNLDFYINTIIFWADLIEVWLNLLSTFNLFFGFDIEFDLVSEMESRDYYFANERIEVLKYLMFL